jgi:hypothetical protein
MLLALTIASALLAVAMSFVAWRASHAERLRSAARVDALAQAINADRSGPFELEIRQNRAEPERAAIAGAGLLSSQAPNAVGSRLGLALAIGAFVVTTAAAAAIVFTSESPVAPRTSSAERPSAAGEPSSVGARSNGAGDSTKAPLELVTLDHERDGDALTVRGVIRNPTSGAEMEHLSAVVSVIGFDGLVVSSARAAVESPALLPGGQSTFAVTIRGASEIGRYRVGFRSGDRVVPHVDKRIGS